MANFFMVEDRTQYYSETFTDKTGERFYLCIEHKYEASAAGWRWFAYIVTFDEGNNTNDTPDWGFSGSGRTLKGAIRALKKGNLILNVKTGKKEPAYNFYPVFDYMFK